ncbi:MAG: hypothetical protein HYZ23_00090, partial [Chloroflexi bacterium]|nr:hypothetical protein [Chloroflexota bacterium]
PTAMSAPVITINPMMQRGQTVTLAAGDVFVVSLPPGYSIWTVNFAGEIIQPLTPAEKMSEPGPQGWLFQAVAAGQTDIRLTAPAPACAQPPCPPAAPVTFVFTIEVK